MASSIAASKRLWKEYRDITDPRSGLKQVKVEVNDDDVFVWKVALLVIDEDSVFYGAYLKGRLDFPREYPFSPPNFKFTPAIYHPNVYSDGQLCISILHKHDDQSDEPDSETWSPAQSVESVLLSILSLLEDPNISSPANVDAAIAFRKHKDEYKKRIRSEVARSRLNMPKGFTMPDNVDVGRVAEEEETPDDDDWWNGENYYDEDEEDEEDEEGDDAELESDSDYETEQSDDEDVQDVQAARQANQKALRH